MSLNAGGQTYSEPGPLVQFLPKIQELLHFTADGKGLGDHLRAGNFAVIDLETTGTNKKRDTVWQVACASFRGFELDEHLNCVVSITREQFEQAFDGPQTDPEKEAKRQQVYDLVHLRWDRIEQEGRPGTEVASFLTKFLHGCPRPILGHNAMFFDLPMLDQWASNLCGREVRFDRSRIIDTGAAVKGGQIDVRPMRTETADDLTDRIRKMRIKGVYWSMGYLAEQLVPDLDAGNAHDALFDCLMLGMFTDIMSRGYMVPGDGRMEYWMDLLHNWEQLN